MRYAILVAGLYGLLVPGNSGQDSKAPQELESPFTGSGSDADYLKMASEELLAQKEARHAAILLLQELPDTREYLGQPVAKAVRADLVEMLTEDLKTATWADLA
jgi:hypothetical protein